VETGLGIINGRWFRADDNTLNFDELGIDLARSLSFARDRPGHGDQHWSVSVEVERVRDFCYFFGASNPMSRARSGDVHLVANLTFDGVCSVERRPPLFLNEIDGTFM
jgi:hypothetical protein